MGLYYLPDQNLGLSWFLRKYKCETATYGKWIGLALVEMSTKEDKLIIRSLNCSVNKSTEISPYGLYL